MGPRAKHASLTLLILVSAALSVFTFLGSELRAFHVIDHVPPDGGDQPLPAWSALDVPGAVAVLMDTKNYASMDVTTLLGETPHGPAMKAIKAYAFNPAVMRLSIAQGEKGGVVQQFRVEPPLDQKQPKVRTSAFPRLKITQATEGLSVSSENAKFVPLPGKEKTTGKTGAAAKLKAEPQAPGLFYLMVFDPQRIKKIPITTPKLAAFVRRIEEVKKAEASTAINKRLPGAVNGEETANFKLKLRFEQGTPTKFAIRELGKILLPPDPGESP